MTDRQKAMIVAGIVGVSPNTAARWLSGNQPRNRVDQERFARVLVKLDDLIAFAAEIANA